MADKRTVRRAYEAAKENAFRTSDGSWSWVPHPFQAFRAGYEAAERKYMEARKTKEPK